MKEKQQQPNACAWYGVWRDSQEQRQMQWAGHRAGTWETWPLLPALLLSCCDLRQGHLPSLCFHFHCVHLDCELPSAGNASRRLSMPWSRVRLPGIAAMGVLPSLQPSGSGFTPQCLQVPAGCAARRPEEPFITTLQAKVRGLLTLSRWIIGRKGNEQLIPASTSAS